MKMLSVPLPGREYEIRIARGLIAEVGRLTREALPKAKRCLVVTDENVGPLYADGVQKGLIEAGFETKVCTLPAGEETKCLAMLGRLYDALTDLGVTRTDCVLALGGGVIGDLAGFAAATILRGIPFVQVPTTLLAQVDSSVGGKVAIDLPAGKNLAGAFWQPAVVVIDPDCLFTLPDREFSAGMAEVIKYGCIRDRALFDRIAAHPGRAAIEAIIDEVILRCCAIKAEIVLADERDTGERRLLNYGHTLGHAVELYYHYETYTHGEAVAVGICLANGIGEARGKTQNADSKAVCDLLTRFDLPTQARLSPDAVRRAVALDKKGEGDRIALILLERIGEAVVDTVSREELFALIETTAKG